MLVKNLQDVKEFQSVLAKCQGEVWLESIYGDRYNLKSELSQYVAMADLLRDKKGELELFASCREDEALLMGFLNSHKEKIA